VQSRKRLWVPPALYTAPRDDEFVDRDARLYSIPRDILAGNGSDELIAMPLPRDARARRHRRFAVGRTYSLYDTLALVQEARHSPFPDRYRLELPLDALAIRAPKSHHRCAVPFASGTMVARRDLAKLASGLAAGCRDRRSVVTSRENALGWCGVNRNVVVLRTLSNRYSLAADAAWLVFAHRR